MDRIYPVTVFTARYSGTYEGAPWIAAQAHADPGMHMSWTSDHDLRGCQGDDVTCVGWFSDANFPIGRGDTPDAAVADLASQIKSDWKPGNDNLMARFAKAVEEAKKERDANGS